ncbi:hypothetical protein MN032_11070 [Agromyces atrinae]|uniref:hypothetical protein n=1 Tax=Agromyces atrinae TaxID=592376 RepID=UPI001F597835|nr:hypothetical protein [Agromyces atrinae]MCI2958239.1 hypothetical protein [Agromyces atrinae]
MTSGQSRTWVLGSTLDDARAHRDADASLAGARLTSVRSISGRGEGAGVDRLVQTNAFAQMLAVESQRGGWPWARRALQVMERNLAKGVR